MEWTNKTIFVTGGTGSMGSALARYLVDKNPKKVIIFSRGWLAQKSLRDELGDPTSFRWFLGDVRDKDRLYRAIKNVDILIHAAAVKCIDACNYNPDECMKTNVTGTQNVIDACIDKKVGRCLFISTDKAVAPVNTYGTSKAMAERLWLSANQYAATDDIKFSVCRYGNVVASSGSVVPLWRKMISDGADTVPITDERCTRFWFTMPNVMKFVDDSISKMQGGEIFIPELPSIRITDLAKAMGVKYTVVGLREGEKIHETMGQYNEFGLIDSGNNPWFLSVEEIRETIN
jgi:UDP-N-acetylglucosamine 4,6-dehydratase